MSKHKTFVFVSIMGLIAAAIVAAALMQDYRNSLFVILTICMAGGVCGIYSIIRLWGKPMLIGFLIGVLATLPAYADPPQVEQPEKAPQVHEDCCGIAAWFVLGFGITIILGLAYACKKLPPPATKPVPPKPIPPPPTNNVPTNPPPQAMTVTLNSQPPALVFSLSAVSNSVYDMSLTGVLMPNGSPCVGVQAIGVDCSADLTNWDRFCTFTNWSGYDGNVLSVLYDAAGTPMYALTNGGDFSGAFSYGGLHQYFRAKLLTIP
jgi:hypothetical protein